MKILAFAASSSKNSINKKLAAYGASLVTGAKIEILDLNDYELPIYSQDKEVELGTPALVKQFLEKIVSADVIVISFAEHNGSYTAAYKNLFDWASRSAKKVYENKKVILLSTSPGPGGAKSVLASATSSMPFFGAQVLGSLAIPSFQENFDLQSLKIKNVDLNNQLLEIVNKLQ
jgi:NAD(P)H-dependent FMN reductase